MKPEKKTQDAIKFLEEFSWLLKAHGRVDISEIIEMVKQRNLLVHAGIGLNNLPSSQSNVRALVGILPNILNDEKIFPSNEDIAEFTEATLGVTVSRWKKKSKFEIIGHTVCHTAQLSNAGLEKVVQALEKLVSGDVTAHKLVASRKEKSLSWNEIIQTLNR